MGVDPVTRGRRLEYFTVFWNCLEGLWSVAAGIMAGSVSLVGFGIDSFIEVASGAALLWRLHHHADPGRREAAERVALRIVGACFLGLAVYIAFESLRTLLGGERAERSVPGIVVAAASLIAMPLLARAKRGVAAGISSGAMRADAKQADFCAWLSAILLGGLLLNATLGWWWTDPAAGLGMVPIIAREGVQALRARACHCC